MDVSSTQPVVSCFTLYHSWMLKHTLLEKTFYTKDHTRIPYGRSHHGIQTSETSMFNDYIDVRVYQAPHGDDDRSNWRHLATELLDMWSRVQAWLIWQRVLGLTTLRSDSRPWRRMKYSGDPSLSVSHTEYAGVKARPSRKLVDG